MTVRIMRVWDRKGTSEEFRKRLRQSRVVAIEHTLPNRDRQLLRGLWYGDRDPKNPANYGKTEGRLGYPMGKVVGKRLSPFLLRKMQN